AFRRFRGDRRGCFRDFCGMYAPKAARPGMTSEYLPTKNPGIAAGVLHFVNSRERLDQKSMPPMPPPGGMPPAPAPAFFFGNSATMASVVIRSAATEAAFWIATRTTLVGSMMPLVTRLPYSPVCESKPKLY